MEEEHVDNDVSIIHCNGDSWRAKENLLCILEECCGIVVYRLDTLDTDGYIHCTPMMDVIMAMFKSRDITLPTKVRLVKAMVFPVVVYGCESWTVKKAEHRRLDAFELWCWRRLLRVPWTARRSNQSILKEISPGISLKRMMLKLKLQYFGHLMWRVDSLEKTLMLKLQFKFHSIPRERQFQRMLKVLHNCTHLTHW